MVDYRPMVDNIDPLAGLPCYDRESGNVFCFGFWSLTDHCYHDVPVLGFTKCSHLEGKAEGKKGTETPGEGSQTPSWFATGKIQTTNRGSGSQTDVSLRTHNFHHY